MKLLDLTRRRLALMTVTAVAATVGAVALAPAAANAGCSHIFRDSSVGMGRIERAPYTGSGAALRAGPHPTCGLRGRFFDNTIVQLYCVDDTGTRVGSSTDWYYSQILGTTRIGWLPEHHVRLDRYETVVIC